MTQRKKNNTLSRLFRMKGIRLTDFETQLGITRPTAIKYRDFPESMDGTHRALLASWKKLGMDIDTIDDICNGELNEENILVYIQKRPQ